MNAYDAESEGKGGRIAAGPSSAELDLEPPLADTEAPPPGLDSRRVAAVALSLIPAALVAYLSFNAGGFFPGPPAYVAMFLCIVLTLRATLAEDPFEGIGLRLVLAAGALALFALETILSTEWSHAPGIALTTFDLPLLYLLVMVLFGSVAQTAGRLALLLRALAATIVVVCGCGLTTRLLPRVWPTSPELANNRLAFPLTYWNALALVAVFGIVLCLHFASDRQERRFVRVLAAAALPVQACTLYFTFSRGGILAALVAVLVYAALGRPRTLLSTLVATLPTTAVALVVAYDANLLATTDPTTPGAVGQGHRVALVLVGCIVLSALLQGALLRWDDRLERSSLFAAVWRRKRPLGAALVAVVAILVVVLHGTISREYEGFINPNSFANPYDLRARLTNPANDSRIYTWQIAWHGFEGAPLLGHGAGTYVDTWDKSRPIYFYVQNAHSLYMETLDELGIVGFVLLIAAILIVLWSAARRVRGPDRALYAVVFSLLLVWALHAGIDWDWQMPALSIVFFVLAGAVLARRRPGDQEAVDRSAGDPVLESSPRLWGSRLGVQTRVFLGLGCLLLGVAPAYVWLAQRKINAATSAFDAGNCAGASSAALSSISVVSVEAQPYRILAYCDIRRDKPTAALTAVNREASLDPNSYAYALDLAVIRAAAGQNPRSAAREALSLNPLDPYTREVWQTFSAAPPSQWQADGMHFVNEFMNL